MAHWQPEPGQREQPGLLVSPADTTGTAGLPLLQLQPLDWPWTASVSATGFICLQLHDRLIGLNRDHKLLAELEKIFLADAVGLGQDFEAHVVINGQLQQVCQTAQRRG